MRVFLWRAVRNCLSNQFNLAGRGIQVDPHCVMCGLPIENSWHQFLSCSYAESCWKEANLQVLYGLVDAAEGFDELVFSSLDKANKHVVGKFIMVLLVYLETEK